MDDTQSETPTGYFLTDCYTIPKTISEYNKRKHQERFCKQLMQLAEDWWKPWISIDLPSSLHEKIWLHPTLLEVAINMGVKELDLKHDDYIWLGASLTYHLWLKRPVQIDSSILTKDLPLLAYLNDIFALEFGWGITFLWCRKLTNTTTNDSELLASSRILLRMDGRGPAELFQNMALGKLSIPEIANFYKYLFNG